MRSRIALSLLLPIIMTGMMNTPASAGDPVAGKLKAEQVCQTCHGMNGVGTMPMVANITGQQELYIIAQLQAYRTGKRQHEQMSIIASMLNSTDIENLAAWYSGIKVTIEMPE